MEIICGSFCGDEIYLTYLPIVSRLFWILLCPHLNLFNVNQNITKNSQPTISKWDAFMFDGTLKPILVDII